MSKRKHEPVRGPRSKRQPRDPSPDRRTRKPTDLDDEKHAVDRDFDLDGGTYSTPAPPRS